jgi:hypothetical protein
VRHTLKNGFENHGVAPLVLLRIVPTLLAFYISQSFCFWFAVSTNIKRTDLSTFFDFFRVVFRPRYFGILTSYQFFAPA